GCARTVLQLAEHHDDVTVVAAIAARLEGAKLSTTASGARRLRGRAWRLLHQLAADNHVLTRSLAMAMLTSFSDRTHPQAGDPQRRLHGELGRALTLLGDDVSDGDLITLIGVPCGRVSVLALARLEGRLLQSISPTTLNALLSMSGAARQVGIDGLSVVDVDMFRRWVSDEIEALSEMPALIGEAAVHWDASVRTEAQLLLGQLAPGVEGTELVEAILRATSRHDCPAEALEDAVRAIGTAFPAVLRCLPLDLLVPRLRLGAPPLTALISTLLIDRPDLPLCVVMPALCEGGEAGLMVGLSALEGASDEDAQSMPSDELEVIGQQLQRLYTVSPVPLRPRILQQLARLLLLSGRLDVSALQNTDGGA
ncbi:MAG: hypothetical protein ACI8S6_006011, partial [Myxococcota bacterium]